MHIKVEYMYTSSCRLPGDCKPARTKSTGLNGNWFCTGEAPLLSLADLRRFLKRTGALTAFQSVYARLSASLASMAKAVLAKRQPGKSFDHPALPQKLKFVCTWSTLSTGL